MSPISLLLVLGLFCAFAAAGAGRRGDVVEPDDALSRDQLMAKISAAYPQAAGKRSQRSEDSTKTTAEAIAKIRATRLRYEEQARANNLKKDK